MLPRSAYQPSHLLGSLLMQDHEIPNLGVGFALEMLSALILPGHGYSAMPLA